MSHNLTILTACHNAQETILRACRSVDGQLVPEGFRIEHLILDGASTDGTIERLGNYEIKRLEMGTARQVERSIRSERDAGFYDAINSGLSLAQGDVIGILNADDFLAGKLIAWKILSVFEMSPVHGVYGDLLYVRRRSGIWRQHRYWRAGRSGGNRLRAGWMPPHPTIYLRKSVYNELGGFRTDFASAADYEFILRLMKRPYVTLHYLPEILVCMEVGGISNRSFRHRLLAHRMDWRAWTENKLSPGLFTLPLKPLRKVPQLWQRHKSFIFPEWAIPSEEVRELVSRRTRKNI
jgi:glycosyltransferase involved in cell wall biosynthesis